MSSYYGGGSYSQGGMVSSPSMGGSPWSQQGAPAQRNPGAHYSSPLPRANSSSQQYLPNHLLPGVSPPQSHRSTPMRSGWGGQSPATGSAAGGHSSFSGHGGASSRHTHHGGYGSGGPGSANKPRHSTARSRNTTTGPAGRFADKPPIAGLFETDLQTSAPDYPGAPAPGARHGAGGQLGSPFGAAASPMSKTPLRQPSRPQFPASPAGNTMTPVRDSASALGESNHCVTVFGFAANESSFVLSEFEQYGVIVRRKHEPNANWMHLAYDSAIGAKKALSKNGHTFGKIMVGVRPCADVEFAGAVKKSEFDSASKILGSPAPRKLTRRKPTDSVSSPGAAHTPQKNSSYLGLAREYLFGW